MEIPWMDFAKAPCEVTMVESYGSGVKKCSMEQPQQVKEQPQQDKEQAQAFLFVKKFNSIWFQYNQNSEKVLQDI